MLAACSTASLEQKQEQIRGRLHSPIRWNVLFDLAEHHGVQALLHQTLSSLQDLVPSEEMHALEQSNQTNLHKALLLSCELIRILDSLSTNGIEVMPYKGPALAEMVYGDIALRQSGDIDLLIHVQDLPRIREAVRELGYVPHSNLSKVEEQAYLKSGYECAFDGTAGRNLLEVQWAIQPGFYAVDFDVEGLFRRAVGVSVAGRQMKTPSAEDLFLVLSLHAAKHVWGRLIWLCDLARIMNLPELNWEQIASRASALDIVRIVRVTLLLANRLLNAPIPAQAESLLPGDPVAQELAAEIETYVSSKSAFDVESLAYFRLMLRLREKPISRMRFVSRLIFTPGPGEWESVRLPEALFPLYRLVRLARLAARLFRT